ncbi:unnamed protein product [Eruca vesicaria subsp. sativa]|uniref:DUF2428 domain-containing protein n=1 Tax=Eruca vesicaria subsp. sativa TaxID=29727 RepID=A0ABC8J538_ERUVS|nr:unnamed protein product [Eruca vesicaria subsp. sativa]
MRAEETEKPIVSLAEAAAKIVPSHLGDHLDVTRRAFSQVSWTWVKMFKESALSTLVDVPLSHIPGPLYEASVDWIIQCPVQTLSKLVSWTCDRILLDLATCGDKPPISSWPKSQAAHFVVLALVLRGKPDSLIGVLPLLWELPKYQGLDKLPLIVWMMAQASRGDLSVGLYSWRRNLLPLISNNKCCPLSMDLILQLVEYILSRPEALTILVNGGGVVEGERVVPLPSLEILLRLTFPTPFARGETTERFEAIYPLLKDVALAPEKTGGRDAMKHVLTFALMLAGEEGNPVLAKEATSIAMRSLTENIDCFEHWDYIYMNNLEASVALLKKLVDEWNNHFLRLSSSSSSPSDTFTVNQTMESFRRKNKRAIAEGGSICSLYKEADKYCKLVSKRLSPGGGVEGSMTCRCLDLIKSGEGDEESRIFSLAEAAAKIDPSHLGDYLVKAVRVRWCPEERLSRFTNYFVEALSRVSFPWVKMFKDSPLSTLIDVPLCHIPESVYETSRSWINLRPIESLSAFVLHAFDLILVDLEAQQGGDHSKSQVGVFVALAIILHSKPEALTTVLPILRENPKYQGQDKLPITVWMMAQVRGPRVLFNSEKFSNCKSMFGQSSKGDLCLGLYSWAHNLLPLVTVSNKKCCCIPQSLDLILQFVEEIMSHPKAPTILVDGAIREGQPLIPLPSFEILVRLTFPPRSARVKSTERVEAIYPLLKVVALSPDMAGGSNAVKQMFTFALRSGRKGIVTGNLALAEEATSIAIWCVLESVDCFEHWDIIYRENLEASVALLKKLVGEQKVYFLRLPSDTLIVNQAMEKFRRKNKKAIGEGGAICSLYKEADKYCKLISKRLSPGGGGLWDRGTTYNRRMSCEGREILTRKVSMDEQCLVLSGDWVCGDGGKWDFMIEKNQMGRMVRISEGMGFKELETNVFDEFKVDKGCFHVSLSY